MPYACIRCQFATNLQVITPYGRGRSLPTWWPFPPTARICSPVQMPSLWFMHLFFSPFFSLLDSSVIASSFAETQQRSREHSSPCSAAAWRLQSELGNITVVCHRQDELSSFFCRLVIFFLSACPLVADCAAPVTLHCKIKKKVATDQ